MNTTGVALAQKSKPERRQKNYPLIVAGYLLLAFGAFQLSGIFWSLKLLAFFGAPRWVFNLTFAQRAGVALLAAALSALFGVYALSGAGKIRKLPLLCTGLALIALVFLHRAVLMFSNAMRHDPIPMRFVTMSGVALLIALLYLGGLLVLIRSRNT